MLDGLNRKRESVQQGVTRGSEVAPSAPTLGVCIVTYNSAEDIGGCLQAVLKQSYPVETIVIVDNASSDATIDVLQPYLNRLTFIASPVNIGFAGGQNMAISHAGTDYVMVLNPDVRLHPDYAQRVIAAIEANPSAGSGCGLLVRADDRSIVDSTGLVMSRTRQVRDRGSGQPADRWKTAGDVFGVSGAAAVYAKSMIVDITINGQFFDETFFAYKEDVDVAWRARLLGWKAVYVPSAYAEHSRGWKAGGRKSIPLFVRRHSYQNHWYTLLKNERLSSHAFVDWPLIAALELIKLAYIAVQEPGLLACWPRIVRLLPEMLRKRKELKSKESERR